MDCLRTMIERSKQGYLSAIPSYCTASDLVIEAILDQAKRFDSDILIEATANQVNQFGGYTGMRPSDFIEFVNRIADKVGFPKEKIIFGGDHLGPLTWQNLPEKEAMENSRALISEYVEAGFKKIHLDTSMRLLDDPRDKKLEDSTIARRGAELYKVAEEAYQRRLKTHPGEMRPCFIIGSEVPIPGGAQVAEDSVSVTSPEALKATLDAYKKAFEEEGIKDAFQNIIGVVVQPGVEFGDADVFFYNRENAKKLTETAKGFNSIVLEGHSTDYQSAKALREMSEDGISILKVGPALTFGLREGLFALSYMEKILIREERRANFIETLEEAMVKDPSSWKKHYHGSEEELKIKRMFSFSDRCRYYLSRPEIVKSIDKLLENMDSVDIPMGMLHQFMPFQYYKVRDGILPLKARELVKDCVTTMVEDYNYATKFGYETAVAKIR